SAKGKFANDKSIGGKPLKVNGQAYKKGVGVMSGSELVYQLDGTWDKLVGHVGMDDEVGDGGSVMFRAYADDKLVFESPNQTGKSVKQLMDLNIKGVKKLRLVLLDGGDGSKDDHGDWVDVKLILKGSK
ncbi:MAG: NPCBM/NEW2 domain-containing protein, partial [Phycisphaerae bacterium]|nr:NPCBM/NEW2 domain-containing protein [Phycisphaerae bacterium]